MTVIFHHMQAQSASNISNNSPFPTTCVIIFRKYAQSMPIQIHHLFDIFEPRIHILNKLQQQQQLRIPSGDPL